LPSPRFIAAATLFLLALLLAAANVWFVAARSTIPLALDGKVHSKEVRHEKPPPKDDVCLLTIDGRQVHVDRDVFERMEVGIQVSKEAWSPLLKVNDQDLRLHWSADFRGMIWTMPLTLGVILAALMCLLAGTRPAVAGL